MEDTFDPVVWNRGMEGRMKSERNPLGAGGATAVYRRWDTDEVAGWILGAFPLIFQNEAGGPYHFKSGKPCLVTWARTCCVVGALLGGFLSVWSGG